MAKLIVNIGIPMVDFTVFLPECEIMRANQGKPLPVLWLYHDYGGNSEDWSRYTLLENALKGQYLAVVCPTGHTSYYSNMDYPWRWKWFEITGEKLLKYCRRTFPLSLDPQQNYIAGYGMGGYGALLQALHAPQQYGFVSACNGHLDAAAQYATGKRGLSICPDIFEADEAIAAKKYDLMALLDKNSAYKPHISLCCAPSDRYYSANADFAAQATSFGYQTTFTADETLSPDVWVCRLIKQITQKTL